MKKIDRDGLQLCKIQGNFFVESLKLDLSSAVFIRRFMYSDFAKHLDTGGYLSEASNTSTALKKIITDYKTKSYGKEKYSVEELYWIGYIYRYFCYTQEMTSKRVFKIIQSGEMRKLYFPYHSLDPQQAIKRIMEAKNIKPIDYLAEGVKIYRRLLQEEKQK